MGGDRRGAVRVEGTDAGEASGSASPEQGRAITHLLTLAMAGTILAGLPLMLVVGQPWTAPLVTAAVVFPGVAIIGFLLRLARGRRRGLIVLGSSAALGAVAGLLLFPPGSYAWFGPLVCVPIALLVAALGLGVDAWLLRSRRASVLIVLFGAVLLALSLVMNAVLYT